jgi:transitional endoplasmic reticulum ATPase
MFDLPSHALRVTFIKKWIQKLKDCAVTFTDDTDKLAEELAKHTENFSFAFLEELFVSSQFVRLRDPDEPLPGEELLRRQVKQLRSQIKPQPPETRRMEWSLVVCLALALVVLSVSLGVTVINKRTLIP